MNISNNGIQLIKQFEGCVLTAYKAVSTETYYTIGYGHYGSDVTEGMTITQEQAEAYLKQDLEKFEGYVNTYVTNINQNQFDALVSFTYNCGLSNLKTLIKNRTTDEIGEAILLYNKSGGVVLQGLVKRRQAEHDLFFSDYTVDWTNVPYEVITTSKLNIRKGPSTTYDIIRTVEKGTTLKVWAIVTTNTIWGKNGEEYYCLDYCTKI